MNNTSPFFVAKNIVPFLVVLFLAGCAQNEISGVCKSCKPYYVRGSWHYPQKHYDYDEVGLASWYGPGFHGKSKPYGELYNQFEMTAAHKTLPLPTIAEVTNLENGKKTKVLIDDRGPYVYEGRIIDLSVAAAKEIGCYGKGTARVRVRALKEESDRFSRHLARYKNGRDPSRRWIQIYQQDLARHSHELKSVHYQELHPPKAAVQLVAQNTPPAKMENVEKAVPVILKNARPHQKIITTEARLQKVSQTTKIQKNIKTPTAIKLPLSKLSNVKKSKKISVTKKTKKMK
jgi:rare lipoprotein A (peptidoglycan hydrolase)